MTNIKNRRLFTSYISITIIMSIVLFLFGFFGIFFISSNSIANTFKENFSVSIFFKEDAKNIEITQLQNELLMSSYVEKLKYVSKDDAVLLMKHVRLFDKKVSKLVYRFLFTECIEGYR